MINKNFHTHTVYCDGKNTAEELVIYAQKLGMTAIGFSGHAYTEFDLSYCMDKEKTERYISEISALKDKYKDKINIFCGIEADFYSKPCTGFDYIIGSVHYIKVGDEYLPVDLDRKTQEEAVEKYFDGDFLSFAEKYFETVGDVVEKTNADIIGHFDLVSKFNEGDCLFDSHSERYVAAWKKAALKLCKTGKVFEINTGAVARGHITSAYPSDEMIEYILQNGGRFIFSSDCHNKDDLLFGSQLFSKCELCDFEEILRNK